MEFKIENIRVYGLNESIIASGYAKSTNKKDNLEDFINVHLNRAITLGSVPKGTGHDCFLKGIHVQMDITASHIFWVQYLRYHFNDIITSQSKMHRITQFNISHQCNKYVDQDVISICNNLKKMYLDNHTKENFFRLIYNLPMGFMLKARVCDNYLSLKTQVSQRKTDKPYEWQDYCEEIEKLPRFLELTKKEL